MKKGLLVGGSVILSLAGCAILAFFVIYGLSGGGDLSGWQKMIFAHRDSFYVGNGQPDLMRIPIFDPYEVIQYPNDSTQWKIGLYYDHPKKDPLYYYSGIVRIEYMAVENGMIMVSTSYVAPPNMMIQWAVLIPSQRIEIGFEKNADFISYIHEHGVQSPRWITPDLAYNHFTRTGCLDWIPDCQPAPTSIPTK